MSELQFARFGVAISFAGDHTVLGVRGDLDPCTAPTMARLLHAVIDQGHTDIVLDLSAAGGVTSAGLGMVASAAARLKRANGALTVRSPSPGVRRIFDVTGLSEHVHLDEHGSDTVALGPQRHSGDLASAVPLRPGEVPTDLGGGLANSGDERIDGALHLLTALASASLAEADGVSVSLSDAGHLRTRAATNDTVRRMDDHQYETGEGPCLSAAAEGREFYIASLADETRWPSFVPLAVEEGIACILSSPLVRDGAPLGSLNIYSNAQAAFGPHDHELAAMFATHASNAVAEARRGSPEQAALDRVTGGLQARGLIAQAQGVLMAQKHLTADEAAGALYRSARAARVPLLRLAGDIVAGTCSDET
jgi:anti-anti-sigma factor